MTICSVVAVASIMEWRRWKASESELVQSIYGGHRAGTRPAPTVVAGVFEHGSLAQRFQLSTTVGHTMGGVAGGIPPHKGGPKARPQRTAVVSGQ